MNAADCAAHALPQDRVLTFDAGHRYTLAELIDIAERNNPRTRIFWERAKQRAEALGVEKSAYYPVLAGIAAFADQRTIVPFPKPLAPHGYTMVEVPVVQPEITLEYLIFDFGKREGRVDEAVAQKDCRGRKLHRSKSTGRFPRRQRLLRIAYGAGTAGGGQGNTENRPGYTGCGRGSAEQWPCHGARRVERAC